MFRALHDRVASGLEYLDSVGMAASLANRVLHRQVPTREQILLWDRIMVPLSRVLTSSRLRAAGQVHPERLADVDPASNDSD